MKNCFRFAFLVLVTFAITSFAAADTLQLVGVNGDTSPSGSVYVGPYQLSVDGTITNLFCLDIDRDISFGETWQATPTTLSSQSSTDQKTAAILYSMIQNGTLNNTLGQLEIWSLLDPGATEAIGETQAEAAFASTLDTSLYGDSFYNQFVVYVAVPDSQSSGGTAQDFIGMNPNPVPEPSTLMMVGSGLAGVVGAMRRRITRS